MMADRMLPGIGDYDPPEYEDPYDAYVAKWYDCDDDRSDGWDEVDDEW